MYSRCLVPVPRISASTMILDAPPLLTGSNARRMITKGYMATTGSSIVAFVEGLSVRTKRLHGDCGRPAYENNNIAVVLSAFDKKRLLGKMVCCVFPVIFTDYIFLRWFWNGDAIRNTRKHTTCFCVPAIFLFRIRLGVWAVTFDRHTLFRTCHFTVFFSKSTTKVCVPTME